MAYYTNSGNTVKITSETWDECLSLDAALRERGWHPVGIVKNLEQTYMAPPDWGQHLQEWNLREADADPTGSDAIISALSEKVRWLERNQETLLERLERLERLLDLD